MACKTCAGRDKKNCLECGPGPTRPSAEEIAKAQGVVAQYRAVRRDEFAKIVLEGLMRLEDTRLRGGQENIGIRCRAITDSVLRELDAPRSAPTDEEGDQGDGAADEK